ncbi:MAG: DNA segregation ATPase FtsK/SpoIIIE, S-DNA-T family [Parcubacteria bacterium C7867-005]|nr:MAG: DNA segregation ATPase FtsK/SpoIIIE, S-DNA-T family [Parcubacteria bacterium C7867-005]
MAKKKRQNTDESSSWFENISKETLNAVLGVLSVVVMLFLLLAAMGKGGPVGGGTYGLLTYLFGIGYYLVAIVFLMLAISFFQAKERDFALPQITGALIFFVSALGLTDLLFNKGGVIGGFISNPLDSLFGPYLSAIIMMALIIISLLVIFDTAIKLDLLYLFAKIFQKKEVATSMEDSEVAAVEKAEEEMRDKSPEETKGKEIGSLVKKMLPKDDSEGFVPTVTKRLGKPWSPPPLSLLEKDRGKPGVGDIKANANQIKRTLLNFGIVVEMDEISIGPSVTRYSLKPAEGVKLSKILGLQNNLELALAAHPVRIEAPIPGKSLVGIEVPNTSKATIGLGSLLSEPGYAESEKPLLVSLGRDVSGHTHFANLAKMPHCLIAGSTGSGKSVTIHAMINSLLFRNPPENLKFIMIDPKRVELTLYNKIPHLLTPVITDAKKAILALKWAAKEMDRRYDILEKCAVRDIDSYHKTILSPVNKKSKGDEEDDGLDPMPYMVIIIDELADLMQAYPRELESAIIRLAQMSRAVGIHLMLSTQRPSVNVITGLIKANVPARIALQVSSQIDSRTILDMAGAEKLLGAGDMLYVGGEMSKPERIQSAYISEGEVKKVVKYLTDTYMDDLNTQIDFTNDKVDNSIFSATLGDDEASEDDDELYEEAREIVVGAGKASTSFLQRKLRVGYARAARLIDMLEERGVIGAGSGAKAREVIGATSPESNFEDKEEDV